MTMVLSIIHRKCLHSDRIDENTLSDWFCEKWQDFLCWHHFRTNIHGRCEFEFNVFKPPIAEVAYIPDLLAKVRNFFCEARCKLIGASRPCLQGNCRVQAECKQDAGRVQSGWKSVVWMHFHPNSRFSAAAWRGEAPLDASALASPHRGRPIGTPAQWAVLMQMLAWAHGKSHHQLVNLFPLFLGKVHFTLFLHLDPLTAQAFWPLHASLDALHWGPELELDSEPPSLLPCF